jgi:hypothetical protein
VSATQPVPALATAGWRQFVLDAQAAWKGLTPRQLVIPAAIGLVWGVGNTLGWWIGHGTSNAAQTAAHFLYEAALPMGLLALGLALVELRSDTGPPRAAPYAVATLVAAPVGEALFILTAPVLGLDRCACNVDRWPAGARVANMLPDGILICGFIAAGYYFRRRSQQRAAALRTAQVEGAQLARQTLESKLQTMQARVEPEFLFDTLMEVQQLYDTDARRADRLLDQLIVYLRAALPQLHEATSTMGKEIDLAHAYLALLKMRYGDRLAFSASAAPDARRLPFPPMVILPLIDHAVAGGPNASTQRGSIDVVASVVPGRLRLVVCSEATHGLGEPGQATIDELRVRLAALYGADARLDLRAEGVVSIATVEIALERADRDHR